jgi:hypothetical protein
VFQEQGSYFAYAQYLGARQRQLSMRGRCHATADANADALILPAPCVSATMSVSEITLESAIPS